jgi:nitroreductase
MSDFPNVLSQRHAAEQFDPTASITRSEIESLVQEASQAPSTFNLQHWRFVAITDPQYAFNCQQPRSSQIASELLTHLRFL